MRILSPVSQRPIPNKGAQSQRIAQPPVTSPRSQTLGAMGSVSLAFLGVTMLSALPVSNAQPDEKLELTEFLEPFLMTFGVLAIVGSCLWACCAPLYEAHFENNGNSSSAPASPVHSRVAPEQPSPAVARNLNSKSPS